MEFSSSAVHAGSETKHDVLVSLEITGSHYDIVVKSIVEKKFGQANRESVITILNEYHIKGAKVLINDLGAWDFAIRARTRTAVKRALKKEVSL